MFLASVTDDMYLELDYAQTYVLLQDLLLLAIPSFEFPRFDIENYELIYIEGEDFYCGEESNYEIVPCFFCGGGYFSADLNLEEKKILSLYMIVEWIGQQLASIEVTRQKYTGSDFKMTSQAAHLQKLITFQKEYTTRGFHLQRLYKRRKKGSDGIYVPTITDIMSYDYDDDEED